MVYEIECFARPVVVAERLKFELELVSVDLPAIVLFAVVSVEQPLPQGNRSMPANVNSDLQFVVAAFAAVVIR